VANATLQKPDSDAREALLHHAVRLERFTIGYNILEGILAVTAGWLAGSVALVGFGFDSAIETTSAVIVLVRLHSELKHRNLRSIEIVERRAERFVGVTLFALCAYVLFEASSNLFRQEVPSESLPGIVIASLSLLIMPFLAVAKRRAGLSLGSGALVADAKETLICTYLSFTLLMGLVLHAWLGWWWADSVAALVMVPPILREAREAWGGTKCEDD